MYAVVVEVGQVIVGEEGGDERRDITEVKHAKWVGEMGGALP